MYIVHIVLPLLQTNNKIFEIILKQENCKIVKCHPDVMGASNATLRLFGCQMPTQVIEASNATLRLFGCQMPPQVIEASNVTMSPRGHLGIKCHLRLLGCQMPRRDYWGIKCHIGIIGVQRPHGPRKRIQNGIQKRLQKLNILQCKCSQKIIIDLISGIFVKQNSKMGSKMGSKRDSRMKEQNGTSMQEIPGKLFCKI